MGLSYLVVAGEEFTFSWKVVQLRGLVLEERLSCLEEVELHCVFCLWEVVPHGISQVGLDSGGPVVRFFRLLHFTEGVHGF